MKKDYVLFELSVVSNASEIKLEAEETVSS